MFSTSGIFCAQIRINFDLKCSDLIGSKFCVPCRKWLKASSRARPQQTEERTKKDYRLLLFFNRQNAMIFFRSLPWHAIFLYRIRWFFLLSSSLFACLLPCACYSFAFSVHISSSQSIFSSSVSLVLSRLLFLFIRMCGMYRVKTIHDYPVHNKRKTLFLQISTAQHDLLWCKNPP